MSPPDQLIGGDSCNAEDVVGGHQSPGPEVLYLMQSPE